MKISEKILNELKEKGMSQKTFSERTGISQSTISDWKRRKINPAVDKIVSICQALEITPNDLFSDVQVPEKYIQPETYSVKKGSDEYVFVDRYRKLEPDSRIRLRGYMDALYEEQVKTQPQRGGTRDAASGKKENAGAETGAIPEVSGAAEAKPQQKVSRAPEEPADVPEVVKEPEKAEAVQPEGQTAPAQEKTEVVAPSKGKAASSKSGSHRISLGEQIMARATKEKDAAAKAPEPEAAVQPPVEAEKPENAANEKSAAAVAAESVTAAAAESAAEPVEPAEPEESAAPAEEEGPVRSDISVLAAELAGFPL